MSYTDTPLHEEAPQNLRELAENLSNTFSENFKRNKPNSALNPSRYLSRTCFESSDSFRDKLGNFDPNTFSFSTFGDELNCQNDNSNTGIKRSLTDSDTHSPNKKRKFNDSESEDEMDITEQLLEDDNDNDSDIVMSSDDDNTHNTNKKKKKNKVKLPEKFKNDEDFQSLVAPPTNPSKADQFFDPINYCKINLDKESRINVKTQAYLNKYELFENTDIEMEKDSSEKYIKHLSLSEINKYLENSANKSGFTVQKDIGMLLCLGLKDHLKDMFDEMNKWRQLRNNRVNRQYRIRYSAVDKQKWIDEINDKYAIKQQISEGKDEIEALETECVDLDFKKMTGILTDEETKRRANLDALIRNAKRKQKRNDELRANAFSLAALGGDFHFGNQNQNRVHRKQEKELQKDRFYVIDTINMIEQNQKYSQQHLRQLSKLHLKHVR